MAMPQEVAKPQTYLEETISRLDRIRDDVGNLTRRLASVIDRAHGSSEKDPSATAPREVPNGMVGSVTEKLSDIENILGRGSELVSRLEALI